MNTMDKRAEALRNEKITAVRNAIVFVDSHGPNIPVGVQAQALIAQLELQGFQIVKKAKKRA